MTISCHMPRFFGSATQFGARLLRHAASEKEMVVGCYKRDSGIQGMSRPESVDEALCMGWIDGVRCASK